MANWEQRIDGHLVRSNNTYEGGPHFNHLDHHHDFQPHRHHLDHGSTSPAPPTTRSSSSQAIQDAALVWNSNCWMGFSKCGIIGGLIFTIQVCNKTLTWRMGTPSDQFFPRIPQRAFRLFGRPQTLKKQNRKDFIKTSQELRMLSRSLSDCQSTI